MFHRLFAVTHLLLALPFAYHAIASYLSPGAGWDAGAIGLFGAFWFVFSAAGFRSRNPWMVTMSFLVMAGSTSLLLLVGFIESWNLGFSVPTSGPFLFPAGILLLLLLTGGEIYALAAFRDRGSDSPRGAPPGGR
jgi:hypothetical protein